MTDTIPADSEQGQPLGLPLNDGLGPGDVARLEGELRNAYATVWRKQQILDELVMLETRKNELRHSINLAETRQHALLHEAKSLPNVRA